MAETAKLDYVAAAMVACPRCSALDEIERLRGKSHETAEQIDAYLTKEHAAPMWWRMSDIAHTAAGCVWDDEAGDDGAYSCETSS